MRFPKAFLSLPIGTRPKSSENVLEAILVILKSIRGFGFRGVVLAQVTESDELDPALACAFSSPWNNPYLPSFEQVGRFRGIGMMQTTVQKAISILKAHVCKMPLFTITDDSNLGNMLVKSRKLLVLLIDVVNTLIAIEFSKRTKKSVSRCRSLGSRKHP